ncbi:hypothetical protein L6452_16837 [Arctium lappa]|uniref:Uncharacterized protein n=1 Tax=Arctium lappa TaxID=4217 RepID=A0ACB9C1W9_ARCLA|nr:hypothetical protein L6452_16837 [Arctium lappa]
MVTTRTDRKRIDRNRRRKNIQWHISAASSSGSSRQTQENLRQVHLSPLIPSTQQSTAEEEGGTQDGGASSFNAVAPSDGSPSIQPSAKVILLEVLFQAI